jgi:uncharacterized protein YkwD
MLRRTAVASAIAALAAGVPGGATAAKKNRAAGECAWAGSIAVDEATREEAIDAVLCLVNRERAARGVAAVRASNPLESAAVGHSDAMVSAKFFSHSSRNGDNVQRRVARTGYGRSASPFVGETIAWGSGAFATPAQLVGSFLSSPEHRQIMLDRRFRDVGVGIALGAPRPAVAGDATTVTLDFGRR